MAGQDPLMPTASRLKTIPSDFAKRTARLLTTRYLMAMIAVAALAGAGQLLVQIALSRQTHDARVINFSGRQRNYSQALCKAVIATRSLDAVQASIAWSEARDILPLWERTQQGLQTGDAGLDLPRNTSAIAAVLFAEQDPSFRELAGRIRAAIDTETLPEAAVGDLLSCQRRFVLLQEQITMQLDIEARGRVLQTRILEATLFGILAIVLMIEVLFIFRPAIRRVREEISARERAEEAAIEREVAEVSGRLERRIGQDLHDGLGQVLTGISFQSKALQRRLGDGPDAQAAADITSQVVQAIAQTRSLARMLHPVEADAESLGAAMHELGSIAEKVFRVQAVVQWDDELPTPLIDGDGHETPPSMHLYRIAQEAVSNAIRHGGAQHVWLTGSIHGDRASLVVADDGSGFQPPTPAALHQHSSGMGLRIMAFRAERIGADFAIERRPEGGMSVTVSWAISDA